jgi:hypothetical protein
VKYFYFSIAIATMIAGCASSNNNDEDDQPLQNLVELQSPDEQPNQPSKVYIDSVKQITRNKKEVLVIFGTFPDACTNLEEVTHHTKGESLHLEFSAWRNPEIMCAQVLSPFTFIYDKLSKEELSSHSEVLINNTSYSY